MAQMIPDGDVSLYWGDELDSVDIADVMASALLVASDADQLPVISEASLLDLLSDDTTDLSMLLDFEKTPDELHMQWTSSVEAKASTRPRKLCSHPGCGKTARVKGHCTAHGGRRSCSEPGCTKVPQVGAKCSDHGGFTNCTVEGCKKRAQSKGLCKTHGGGMRCQADGCTKAVTSNGRCRSHGGGSKCSVANCEKWAQRRGLCTSHAKQM
ncbi:hypothetical protein SPRG_10040 [Saprolegnia parasitica CBS 223.65]|uniref:WRKY19-like zinc finger domain-containing protein n=1 Tax=Saprolegnia parasitica (strain CBS 223.65) TaxID=695850 RepID=A0A067C427_SAPPC|nr:hypothetical protein SPRG_10040 [Saprolegnia parasitica CBS 223.65]KDO23895.1 hypothetical protein SPRG_10040 [Saprolegnia parasitica CBS 223.65]|eukprot:XP_012205365.1 hypothetical protein SPRG_10040 [Saprolegnia parasitica CBS 223.65]